TAANRIRNRRVANRRSIDVKRLVVPPDHLVFEREEIDSGAEVTWLTVLSEDLREAHVRLKCPRYDHRRSLDLKRVVEQPCGHERERLWRRLGQELEIVDPAPEVLAFNRKAAVLESAVDCRHAPARVSDRRAGGKQVGREDDCSVRESKLCVFKLL